MEQTKQNFTNYHKDKENRTNKDIDFYFKKGLEEIWGQEKIKLLSLNTIQAFYIRNINYLDLHDTYLQIICILRFFAEVVWMLNQMCSQENRNRLLEEIRKEKPNINQRSL